MARNWWRWPNSDLVIAWYLREAKSAADGEARYSGVIPGRYAKIKVRCILWCWSRIDDNEEGGKSWDGMEKHYLEMLNVDDNVKRRLILILIFVEGKRIKVSL